MIRTSNKQASYYVTRRQDFIGSNTFGIRLGKFYVVFSHGRHFPMYVYLFIEGQWYGNSDKCSISTSKQQTQLHPNEEVIMKTTRELIQLYNGN